MKSVIQEDIKFQQRSKILQKFVEEYFSKFAENGKMYDGTIRFLKQENGFAVNDIFLNEIPKVPLPQTIKQDREVGVNALAEVGRKAID